jgi:hypothetical protein
MGRWNGGRRFALGWSAQGSRPLGLGKGLTRTVFRAKVFRRHINLEPYSKPQVIEKKNSPRAASYASR